MNAFKFNVFHRLLPITLTLNLPRFHAPPPVLCSLIDGEMGLGRPFGGETGRDAIARSLVAFFEEEARFIIGLDGRRLVSTSCPSHFSRVLPYVVGDIDVHTPLHAMSVSWSYKVHMSWDAVFCLWVNEAGRART